MAAPRTTCSRARRASRRAEQCSRPNTGWPPGRRRPTGRTHRAAAEDGRRCRQGAPARLPRGHPGTGCSRRPRRTRRLQRLHEAGLAARLREGRRTGWHRPNTPCGNHYARPPSARRTRTTPTRATRRPPRRRSHPSLLTAPSVRCGLSADRRGTPLSPPGLLRPGSDVDRADPGSGRVGDELFAGHPRWPIRVEDLFGSSSWLMLMRRSVGSGVHRVSASWSAPISRGPCSAGCCPCSGRAALEVHQGLAGSLSE